MGSAKPKVKRVGVTLDHLLSKNRSHRGYLKDYVVKREELERIVAVNTKIPSACNRQSLRFHLVTRDNGADKVLPLIKLGAALPELHLPLPGTEPEAFVVVCNSEPSNRWSEIDLGISLQSMLLKAVEMGLNGICVGAFNKEKLKEALLLEYDPMMILAIGKGIEKIELKPISQQENHAYFRENGVHYVPKVRLDDLIV